jgi:hypothetical protein
MRGRLSPQQYGHGGYACKKQVKHQVLGPGKIAYHATTATGYIRKKVKQNKRCINSKQQQYHKGDP